MPATAECSSRPVQIPLPDLSARPSMPTAGAPEGSGGEQYAALTLQNHSSWPNHDVHRYAASFEAHCGNKELRRDATPARASLDIGRSVDQREVRKRLRKVADLAPPREVIFLRKKPEVVT